MGLPVEVNNLMLGSLGGYTVGRSLRFRSSASAYLNRTPASAGNQQKWTWSGWVKRGALGSAGVVQNLFTAGTGDNARTIAFFQDNNTINFVHNNTGTYYGTITTAVFRDPSAWYHIVFSIDTTQATTANRVRIYVNGVEQTATSAFGSGYIQQNINTYVNSTSPQVIGANPTYGLRDYYDGYLAEVNLIDGQQLTPSSFGAYDTNGVWQPKKYSGSYGTNGFYLPFSLSATSSYAGGFNGSSQSLSGTLASAIGSGNFTIEGWVRQNTLTNYQTWFAITRGAGGFNIGTDASGNLVFYSSSARQIDVAGVMKTNQWQHIAFVRNGTTLTAYLNGIARATATVSTNFSATSFYIGSLDNTQEFLNASMSNLRLTNTAVYTSNFIPSAAPLSAVSGTILLTLQSATVVDNSGNSTSITNTGSVTMSAATPFADPDIAADYSGNVNNWTPNNISLTAGTTYDSMIDSPTNSASSSNYAVINPIGRTIISGSGYSNINGNLDWTTTTSAIVFQSTMAMTSGKWYAEFTATTANQLMGVWGNGNSAMTTGAYPANYWDIGGPSSGSALTLEKTSGTATGTIGTLTTNDVIGVAVDIDNTTIYFYRNNTLIQTVTGMTISGPLYFASGPWSSGSNSTGSVNFGQRPFTYTPPSGYKALNTYNLPAPSIANGAQYMAATTYTGNNSTNNISTGSNNTTGITFQPDLVWLKCRSSAEANTLVDSVRGNNLILISSPTGTGTPTGTAAERTGSYNNGRNNIAISSTGVQITNSSGLDDETNLTGRSYIGWMWKAGGTGVTNNSGTITSTVSASPSSGFSIATYTGTGASATVGHGLGVAPSMIIVKCRSNAGTQWPTYHVSMGATKAMNLDATSGAITYNLFWNNTAPTSSVFSIGSVGADTNINGATFVAYCFAAVSGYSAFGSYTGNGSADGPFIYTGFRPRFVMIKGSSFVSNWNLNDSSRSLYNLADLTLRPNLSAAEFTSSGSGFALDFLSNGFKLRANYIDSNSSGDTFIYAAFAENPFSIARAR